MHRYYISYRLEVLWKGSSWVPNQTHQYILLAFLAQGKILELYLALNLLISLSQAGRVLAAFQRYCNYYKRYLRFFNVVSNCRCTRVLKPLAYLGARAYTAVLPRGLRACNLLLLEGPSCLIAIAFYRVSVEFPFRSSRDFKGGIVDVNKRYKQIIQFF